MYSSSSDLITIMIRRMFPSWRKDVDVGGGGGGGALVMVTIMMMGLVILIIMIMIENNIMTMLVVMAEVVGSEARLNPE